MNPISAKHKLVWLCMQCCMIGDSNNLVTMKLVEGSNHIDYILFLLSSLLFSKSIEMRILLKTFCTSSMIAFACGWYVVTCSWFGFNVIIVIYVHFLNKSLN
jgi:hypothetical protein